MPLATKQWRRRATLGCALLAFAAAGTAGAAEQPSPAPLELRALTGPAGADLTIEAPAGAAAFEHVHVRIHRPGTPDEASRVINLKGVAIRDGMTTVDLGTEERGAVVNVDAHVRGESPPRTL